MLCNAFIFYLYIRRLFTFDFHRNKINKITKFKIVSIANTIEKNQNANIYPLKLDKVLA